MYFLSDLQEDLQKHQAKFGNVPLSYAQVGHAKEAVVDHYEDGQAADPSMPEEGPGHTDLPDPDLEKLLALSLEDRLKLCRLGGVVAVTGEELYQLLEFKAEAIAADANKKPPEGTAPTLRVEHDVEAQGKAAEAAGEPLAKVAEDAAQRAAGE
jgi:hypothetical protein